MSIATRLLSEWNEEAAGTRKLLDLIPDDKLMWKPHPKSMELGRLAWHLVDFPEWCHSTVSQDLLKMTQEDGAAMMDAWKGKARADMLARFDAGTAEVQKTLQGASDEEMHKHWKMEWSGQVVIDSPKADVIRKWVLNHMVHHRAQLGLYLRMLDVRIPGLYGPSADEEGG